MLPGDEESRMTPQDQVAATDRLRRALLAFQAALNLLLGAERRLKALPRAEVDAFWDGQGRRVEATVRAAATEAVTAFQRFLSPTSGSVPPCCRASRCAAGARARTSAASPSTS